MASFFLVSIPVLLASLSFQVLSIATTLIYIPVQIAQFFIAIFSTIFAAVVSFAQNKRALFVFVFVVALVFTVGILGRNQTTYFIEAINIINDCLLRPVYETFNKVVMLNWRSAYRVSAIFINRALSYTFTQISIAYLDLAAIIDCIFKNYNVSDLLKIPFSLWSKLIVPLFYVITTKPLMNKKEIFDTGIYGYYSPKENTALIKAQFGDGRFEFDEAYGAQGPAPTPGIQNRIIFPVRDLYVQAVGLIGATGDLAFRLVADLGRPGQKFFPNWILSVDVEESYWREISDLTCRTTELALFTFLWPADFSGVQLARDNYADHACRLLRIIACFLRFVTLLINDVLTFSRSYPIPIGATCPPPPTSVAEYLLQLLQGVPIVDLFVSFELGANLNIFKSSMPWCKFGASIVKIGSNDPNNDPSVEGILSSCTGITRGSYSTANNEICPEWDGSAPPLSYERIDYLGEFFKCILEAILLSVDSGEEIANLRTEYTLLLDLIKQYLNTLILNTVYYFDVKPEGACQTTDIGNYADTAYVDDWIMPLIITTLDYVYRPDNCAKASPDDKGNPFLCLIAIGSRAKQGFFETICSIYDFIDVFASIPHVKCDFSRKRSAFDHFQQKPKAELSLQQRAKIHAMSYAYHGRETWKAAELCRAETQCNSTCAIAPCVAPILDCVVRRLPDANPWKALLDKNSTSSFYPRNGLIGAAVASDVLAGCSDNAINIWNTALGNIVDMMRDIAVRYVLAAHRHAPTYERCSRGAHEAARRGVPAIEITRQYLACIGMSSKSKATNDRQFWSETLEENGISKNDTESLCASVLHENGFLVDQIGEKTGSAEHVAYRTCSFMLAYGSSAVSSNSTDMVLSDFTSMTMAPLAILHSTSRINALNYPEQATQFLSVSSSQLRLALPFEQASVEKQTRRKGEMAQTASDFLDKLHPYLGVLYAYVNYMAEVYERAVIIESSGSEKDRIDREIYAKFVAVAAAANTVRKRGTPQPQSPLRTTTYSAFGLSQSKNKHSGHQSRKTMHQHSELRPLDFSLFARSFYWVDQISGAVETKLSPIMLQVQNDTTSVRKELSFRGGSTAVEMYIDARSRLDLDMNLITFGLREIKTSSQSRAFGYLTDQSANVDSDTPRFRVGNIQAVVDALDQYSRSINNPAAERQEAAQAVANFKAADALLRSKNAFDSAYKRLSDSRVISGFRTVLQLAFRLINNRVMIESTPAYQSASVAIDALTGGDSDSIKGWLNSQLGYIPQVGYVSIDSYNEYMQIKQEQRAVYLRGYLSEPPAGYDHNFYLLSTRRNARARVQALREAKSRPTALGGSTVFQRWIQKKRAGLHNVDYTHRAAFLRTNKLTYLDDMMHHAAGPNWQHYDLALSLADNPVQRVEFALITASPNTIDFWIELGDSVLSFLGFGATVITDQIDQFRTLLMDIGEFLFVDTLTHLQDFGTSFLDSAACTGINDYGLAGTGPYRWGCLPKLPERAFEWITVYPAPLANPKPLDTFTGPGYIGWPADMLAVGGDCVKKRDPNQCGAPVGVFEDFLGYFQNLCITDACRDPTKLTRRPLCPVCDYCEREWKSAVDFGYTDGWKNLATYDSFLRLIIDNAFTTYDAYVFVIAFFVFLEFATYLSVGSPIITLAALLLTIWGELFIAKRYDRLLTVFSLWTLTNAVAGLGWGIFIFYVVALFGPFFGIIAVPPVFMTSIVTFVKSNLLPGSIVRFLVHNVIVFLNFIGGLSSLLFVDTTSIVAIETDFIAAATTPPTFSQVFYSVASVINLAELIPIAGGIVLLGVLAIGVVIIVLVALVAILAAFFACFGLCSATFQSFVLWRTSVSVTDLQDELVDRIDELEEDEDALAQQLAKDETATRVVNANNLRRRATSAVKNV